MADNKKSPQHGFGEDVQVAIGKAEAFIEKYQKQLIYAVLGIVIVICGIILVKKFIFAPQEIEAENQMAKGQEYLQVDSVKYALNGDGAGFIGFDKIIDDYDMTKSANAAKWSAGVAAYEKGDYQKAIDYFTEFDANGSVNPSVVVNIGIADCYVELKNYEKAYDYYNKAIKADNSVFSPVALKKAGILYEFNKNFDKAIEYYTQIKDKYSKSSTAQDIDKYIERATLSKK